MSYEQYLERRKLIPWRTRAWENIKIAYWSLCFVTVAMVLGGLMLGALGDIVRSICGCA